MDQPGHQLLTGAVVTEDQDSTVRRGGQGHLLPQVRHGGAVPNHRVALLPIDLGTQDPVLRFEVALPQRIAHYEDGLLKRQRFLDEVERAHLDGPHRRLDVAVSGNDHDL